MKLFPVWWVESGACACPAGVECPSPGKHPLTRNGVKDASDDAATLQAWREQYPYAHWAVATGNGLLVVDLDVRPGKDGRETFKKLGAVPRTYTVRTGSGGLHLYFRVTGKTGNTAGKLGAGIDTRGDGGYVLAPPSGHVSGGVYSVLLNAPVADAPAWLTDRLTATAPAAAPKERGWFPAASEEVLEQAREALERHGPAIQGNGGDLHTFRAAAILRHDFALTEAEAAPLFEEWNETCQPEWSASDLRAKLRGGEKYGTAEYGCRRNRDAYAAAVVKINEWDGKDETLKPMLDVVRTLAALTGDPAQRGMLERDLSARTGLKSRALALPKVLYVAPVIKRGEILVTTELHKVADEATRAIAAHVFSRNGILCEVVTGARTFISDLEVARIQDLMSAGAKFVRVDGERGTVSQAAPAPVASIIASRRMHHGVRVLEALTTAPVFLADGTILQTRGYSEQARVWLEPSVSVDVPDDASLEDAEAAVARFRDLLCDFKFASDGDFSSWLAGLLSPLVKPATGNAPGPLICVSASNPGVGKTLLTDIIARIVTGGEAEIRPYSGRTNDTGEWGKRLTSFVKMASPVSVFDNVNGPIGDEGLDRLITSAVWSDRILGVTDAPPMPNVTAWFATGNNIEPMGDTVRRVLMVRIETETERPQERTGFKYVLPAYVDENRPELLAGALTILRAYHNAGRPDQRLPEWGSFTAWSRLVRGALVWAGCADPFETQKRATAELQIEDVEAHDFWMGVVEASDGSPRDIAHKANDADAAEILGLRESLTPRTLRKFLNRYVDKPRDSRRIRRAGTRYSVEFI